MEPTEHNLRAWEEAHRRRAAAPSHDRPGLPDQVRRALGDLTGKRVLHLVMGTMLAAGGTLALNQYIERDIDARMERTRLRPLPDGRLMPLEALLFGSALTGLGLVYLAACVNVRAALVTTVVVVLYLFAYTPLKLRTPLSTLVGAVPGALPPVTGWVAARDDVGLGAAVLFGILFLWQLPHTLAIARLYREDYARAGVLVLPVVDEAGASTDQAREYGLATSDQFTSMIWEITGCSTFRRARPIVTPDRTGQT